MTRKQMKEREERRRLRTVRWLANSEPGTLREPDTDSDEDVDGKALRIPSKKAPGVATPPTVSFPRLPDLSVEMLTLSRYQIAGMKSGR